MKQKTQKVQPFTPTRRQKNTHYFRVNWFGNQFYFAVHEQTVTPVDEAGNPSYPTWDELDHGLAAATHNFFVGKFMSEKQVDEMKSAIVAELLKHYRNPEVKWFSFKKRTIGISMRTSGDKSRRVSGVLENEWFMRVQREQSLERARQWLTTKFLKIEVEG